MYSWTVGLPKETKIIEAYKMLKQTGTVTIISRNMIMYFVVDLLTLLCRFIYLVRFSKSNIYLVFFWSLKMMK